MAKPRPPSKYDGKPLRDDLPPIAVQRFRKTKAITPEMTEVEIDFGDEAHPLRRMVGVQHVRFPGGGGWSFFMCPGCGARVTTLRLYAGKVTCRHCDGLQWRSIRGPATGKAGRLAVKEALVRKQTARLEQRYFARTERSLLSAQVALRRAALKGWRDAFKKTDAE